MTLKSTDNGADTFLILIVPVALAIMFLFSTWRLLVALAVGILLWNIFERYRWQQWSRSINPMFHTLIQENQGRVTVIDLAMKANLSAAKAKQYLDNKASEFGARVLEPEDGISAYFFVTAKTLGSIFDESEPPLSLPESQAEVVNVEQASQPLAIEARSSELVTPASGDSVLPEEMMRSLEPITEPVVVTDVAPEAQPQEHAALESLLQSELAKRLDVNSSTIYKHRSHPDFAEWSQSRDPQGVAWQYSEEDKRFFPITTSS